MSDEHYPYEKAVEETAKATNNTVDLIREGGRAIGPSVGNIYGLLIGDRVSAARSRRLDEIARKTKKILEDRDVSERLELPEDVAIPILEAAQGETREELQNLWARLLANAMDPLRSNNVRAEFVETVRRFEPVDTRIYLYLQNSPGGEWPMIMTIAEALSIRSTAAEISVDYLVNLRCVLKHPANPGSVRLSPFGRELYFGLEP